MVLHRLLLVCVGCALADVSSPEWQSCADDTGLSLLQKRVGAASAASESGHGKDGVESGNRKDVDGDRLPAVMQLNSAVQANVKQIGARMSELQEQLAKVEHRHENEIAESKHDFEQRLRKQNSRNSEVAQENAQLSQKNSEAQTSIQSLRRQASDLQTKNAEIAEDISQIQANLTVAQEYVAEALKESTAAQRAPELEVLHELDKQDKEQKARKEHDTHLQEISSGKRLSLLSMESKPVLDPEALMKSLATEYLDLAQQRNASLQALKQAFEKEFDAGEHQYKSLVEKRKDLEAVNKARKELADKLQSAVRHLQKEQKELKKRRASLRKFTLTIGSFSAGKGDSLLQTSTKDKEAKKKAQHTGTSA
mmetsp:Transcript_12328/g.28916  ORF Transcript_12328/g.28916 Transcript_12328/m.28916 type:complete len:367 (+) Transcript_12328:154-1254(+)|eukprot:CAMPEP_0178414380 /NCGR_PEP_ID=MMETSP0689_2-20121128/23006_1 /TAXON_ID=160604 /ORGANISM="Amphidinium massartii, Strain CS-259" /LENGTH=366 /DNA_ID=CAMNT_0020035667 /DNA_START=78 /DNA_END=1178 /DNA_ORIENTATION=+